MFEDSETCNIPSLKDFAYFFCGKKIQEYSTEYDRPENGGRHDSIIDARATMQVCKIVRKMVEDGSKLPTLTDIRVYIASEKTWSFSRG